LTAEKKTFLHGINEFPLYNQSKNTDYVGIEIYF
jgi:hypothetical protein